MKKFNEWHDVVEEINEQKDHEFLMDDNDLLEENLNKKQQEVLNVLNEWFEEDFGGLEGMFKDID